MKMLTVAAFICTIMALTIADAETELVKRTWGHHRWRHHRCPHGWRWVHGCCVPCNSRRWHSAHGIQLSSAETDLVKRTRTCLTGWKSIDGRCFYYVSRPLRWAQAEKNCQGMGGNLASVHSYEEYSAIQRLVISRCHKNKRIWIGGHDAEEEKIWLWSNGKQFTYRNWCRGEPNNYLGNQHCLIMNHSAQKCWDDAECSQRNPSVCVKQP